MQRQSRQRTADVGDVLKVGEREAGSSRPGLRRWAPAYLAAEKAGGARGRRSSSVGGGGARRPWRTETKDGERCRKHTGRKGKRIAQLTGILMAKWPSSTTTVDTGRGRSTCVVHGARAGKTLSVPVNQQLRRRVLLRRGRRRPSRSSWHDYLYCGDVQLAGDKLGSWRRRGTTGRGRGVQEPWANGESEAEAVVAPDEAGALVGPRRRSTKLRWLAGIGGGFSLRHAGSKQRRRAGQVWRDRGVVAVTRTSLRA
jgi:hypothetical protein